MKKVIFYEDYSPTYTFPALFQPVRRQAVNDNHIPMLSMILKHSVLMSAAFLALYLIHTLI